MTKKLIITQSVCNSIQGRKMYFPALITNITTLFYNFSSCFNFCFFLYP